MITKMKNTLDSISRLSNIETHLHELEDMKLGTKTAARMWKERIAYYIGFYETLNEQLEKSTKIL